MNIVPIEDHRFVLKVLLEADRLAKTNPAQLTDLHLRHLVIYDAEGAHRGAAAREKALTAEREKAAAVAFAAAMELQQQTSRATTTSAPAAATDVSLEEKEYLQKHGHKTVTLALLFQAVDTVFDVMADVRKHLDHRLQTLEALTENIEKVKEQQAAIQSLRAVINDLVDGDLKKRLTELELALGTHA